MKNNQDYYKILQVDFHAENEVIEAAYKKLCKKYHPDVCKDLHASEKIQSINQAYETLSNASLRAKYNLEWMKKNKKTTVACKVIYLYFSHLAKREYDKAYLLLCNEDKKNISRKDFSQWQASVSKLYQIIDCSINRHTVRIIKNNNSVQLLYDIRLTERNLETNDITYEYTSKIIKQENNNWHIELGYKNIKGFINKFQCRSVDLLDQSKEINMHSHRTFGGKKSFLYTLHVECERSRRYQRKFSIVFIKILPHNKKMKASIFTSFKKNIRLTDTMIALSPYLFLLLLPETNARDAKVVCMKLKRKAEQIMDPDQNCYFGISEYRNQTPQQFINESRLSLARSIKSNQSI